MACGDVVSLESLQIQYKHQVFEAEVITGKAGGVAGGAGIDYATNQVTGQVQKTMPAIMRDLGFEPASFDFTSGGTLGVNDRSKAVLWPLSSGGDGYWYYWEGALQKVIPAASTPSSTGGVANGAWRPVGDVTLRDDLASSGGGAIVGTSIGSTVEVELALARPNRNTDGTLKASRVVDVNGLDVEDDYQQTTKHRMMQAPLTSQGGVIFLGDSIGNSQGATNYKFGYLYRFMRSLLNRAAGVGAKDQGFGYESYLNMSFGAALDGITHTGTVISGSGAADSRLQLTVGQYITITGRQAQSYDVFIDPAASSGNIEFYLNGALYATDAVGAAISTFPTSPFLGGGSIHPDDVVQIKAATGTVIVTGITTLREATAAPYVTSVCRSGWGFDEFAVQARIDEVTNQVKLFKSGGPFTLFVMLGTNNIYNQGLRKSPADYITALNTLIGKYVAALNGLVNVVIQVPLKANETTFPPLTGYVYTDYVKAIVEYGSANNYPVIRFDRIGASDAYYADGIHPNNAGHAAMAAKMCDQIGVPFAYGEFHQTPTLDHYREADIAYNAKYRSYTNNSTFQVRCHKQGRLLMMSGLAEPNGAISTDLVVGLVPIGFGPILTDIFTVADTNTGPAEVVIKRDRTINVKSVPTGWISFTGVSFILR